jgi:ArsR family transcriptional regulator
LTEIKYSSNIWLSKRLIKGETVMENLSIVLKALADDTRLQIIRLLLQHNFCGRVLAKNLDLTESAISQHLKVLREANLLVGEKRGYFMHYAVNRDELRVLANQFEQLAELQRETNQSSEGGCQKRGHCKCI